MQSNVHCVRNIIAIGYRLQTTKEVKSGTLDHNVNLSSCMPLTQFLWPPYGIGQAIIFWPWFLSFSSFFLSSFFLVYSQRPQIGCLPEFHTPCAPSANLECKSEMCCSARSSLQMQDPKNRQKIATWTPSHNFVGLFATMARIDNRKKLLSNNISPTCPYNMVNFGLRLRSFR